MSTATAARDRRRSTPAARARRRRPRRRLAPVWWLAGGLVTVAFVVAVIVGGGSDDSTTDVEQTRTVHISGTALPAYSVDGADAAVGLAIPAVEGSSFDGSPVSLADTGPKVLVFAAHWCPHCQREIPLLADHMRTSPPPASIEIVTIVTGTDASLPNYPPSEWLARERWTTPVLVDDAASSVGTAFGLTGYPYFVAVGAEGRVVVRASGELSVVAFDALMTQALAGA